MSIEVKGGGKGYAAEGADGTDYTAVTPDAIGGETEIVIDGETVTWDGLGWQTAKRMPAMRISGHWWYADIFVGPVPILKALAFANLVTLAVALFG